MNVMSMADTISMGAGHTENIADGSSEMASDLSWALLAFPVMSTYLLLPSASVGSTAW